MVVMGLTGLLVPSSCVGRREEQITSTDKVRALTASKVRGCVIPYVTNGKICKGCQREIKMGVHIGQLFIAQSESFEMCSKIGLD